MVSDKTAETKIEELAAHTLRPPKRLTAEDLVASELATATLAAPLDKIRHIIEALMFLDENERRQAGITQEEVEEAEKLYSLAIMFRNVAETHVKLGDKIEKAYMIQWPFNPKEAEKWKEWLCPPNFKVMWLFENLNSVAEYNALVKKAEENRVPKWEVYYHFTHGRKLLPDTIKALETNFTTKAMPKAAVIMKKIMGLVSPDSYRQALRVLRSDKNVGPRH